VALPLAAFFLLGVAVTIVVEGALSFLGLGVPPPTASWGSMIGEGRESLDIAPNIFLMARNQWADACEPFGGKKNSSGCWTNRRSPTRKWS